MSQVEYLREHETEEELQDIEEEVMGMDVNLPEMVKAKQQEDESWKLYEVYDAIEDCGQKAISTR